MDRNYDEVISEILIQLDNMEKRMEKADKRMALTIKRLVKSEQRMELLDKKLERSIRDQKEFSEMQSKLNKYFLDFVRKRSR